MQVENPTNLKAFSVRLKSTIKRRHLTLNEVAIALGKTSPSVVGNWTAANNYPETEDQAKLAEFLGETVDWLIHGKTGNRENSDNREIRVEESPTQYGNEDVNLQKQAGDPSRLKLNPGFEEPRLPSTRADCERYIAEYFDLAQRSRDPDAFPHAMRLLRKYFQKSDWDEKNEPPT